MAGETIIVRQGLRGIKGDKGDPGPAGRDGTGVVPSAGQVVAGTATGSTLALGAGTYPKGDGTNVVAGDFAADVAATAAVAANAASVATMKRKVVYLADYVTGDGSNETTKIQQALDAAAGGTLVCADDLVVWWNRPVQISSNTRIKGYATFRQIAGTTGDPYPLQKCFFYAKNASGITIRDVTIDVNHTNAPDGMWDGVFFDTVTDSVIERITVTDMLQVGIRAYYNCQNVRILNNKIIGRSGLTGSDTCQCISVQSQQYNGTNGLTDNSGVVAFDTTNSLPKTTQHVIVRGNICLNGTHGVALTNVAHVVVEGNDCQNNSHRGVILGNSEHCTVTANVITQAGSTGIHMAWGCYHNTITGNTVDVVVGTEGDGIKGYYGIGYNTISGNTVYAPASNGIRLAVNAHNNVVEGNTVHSAGVNGVVLMGYLDPAGGYPTPNASFPTKHNQVIGNKVFNCPTGINLTDNAQTGTEVKWNIVALNSPIGCGTGMASSNTVSVIDNVQALNFPTESTTTNVNNGANAYRYNSFFNGDPGARYQNLTAFSLQATASATSRKITNGSAAPTSGTWAVGDICFNVSPTAGGTVGWVCTAAGSPGTWKTFGTIAA